METIELKDVMNQLPVVENLKNYAGVDAQNALGMMTPERLAAVVGEKLEGIGFANFRNYGSVSGDGIDDCDNGIGYSVEDKSGITAGAFISISPVGIDCAFQIKIALGGGLLAIRGRDFRRTWSEWKSIRLGA